MTKTLAIIAGEPNSISSEIIFKSWKLKNQFITSENILITRERHRKHLKLCVDHLEKFENRLAFIFFLLFFVLYYLG